MKTTVSLRAFLARMRRNLAKDRLTLRACRVGERYYSDLGPFFTVNEHNAVRHQQVDYYTLITWARQDAVLKPYEIVEGLEEFEKGRSEA